MSLQCDEWGEATSDEWQEVHDEACVTLRAARNANTMIGILLWYGKAWMWLWLIRGGLGYDLCIGCIHHARIPTHLLPMLL